jgi:hypothetical protein
MHVVDEVVLGVPALTGDPLREEDRAVNNTA